MRFAVLTAVCIQQGFTIPLSAHPLPGLTHSESLQCSLPCGFQRNTDAHPSPLETYCLERSSLLPPRPLTSHHEDPPSGSWVLGFLQRKRSLCVRPSNGCTQLRPMREAVSSLFGHAQAPVWKELSILAGKKGREAEALEARALVRALHYRSAAIDTFFSISKSHISPSLHKPPK